MPPVTENLLDSPRIEPWMQEAVVRFRQSAPALVRDFLSQNESNFGRVAELKVFPQGSWSCVFKVTTDKGIYILKTTPRSGVLERESFFLNKWREVGIRTPEIFGLFELPGDAKLLSMEYVGSSTLGVVEGAGELRENVYREIGEIMAKTHTVLGYGFGEPSAEDMTKGEYSSFDDYVMKDLLVSTIEIFPQFEDRKLDSVLSSALSVLATTAKSSLCHFDVHGLNIFYTSPLTLFDPNPAILPGILDLANTLFMAAANSPNNLTKYTEIKQGYSQVGFIDESELVAALKLVALNKLKLWQAKGKLEKVSYIFRMLETNFEELSSS